MLIVMFSVFLYWTIIPLRCPLFLGPISDGMMLCWWLEYVGITATKDGKFGDGGLYCFTNISTKSDNHLSVWIHLFQ